MMAPRILVSACLCGEACRYDGKASVIPLLQEAAASGLVLSFCPEKEGGLPVPRPPAEIVGERVLTREGRDVTGNFQAGAVKAVQLCARHGLQVAVLKDKSPSCGVCRVYDGTFSGTLRPGRGMTAKALLAAGVKLYTEDQAAEVIAGFVQTELC